MNIADLQRALKAAGFDPGPIDGRFGDLTRKAVKAFQSAKGLYPDGVVGPLTRAALEPNDDDDGATILVVQPTQTGAMLYQGTARYPVREIVVHCAATRPEWMAGRSLAEKRTEIRRWHMQDRGWSDIGYHWLIDRDGQVMAGRRETVIGAHVAGRNNGTIGVSLIGGFGAATTDKFLEHFTPAQDVALRKLIREISGRTQIRIVSGHYQYANKACPGFDVGQWLAA